MPVVIDEKSLPKEFLCPACHRAWDPSSALACHACEDVYCSACVDELEAKSSRCCNASCDTAVAAASFTPVHRVVRNLADARVAVKCNNFVFGCPWSGVRSDAAAHESSCKREKPSAALYVEDVPAELECPVCQEALLDPLQLEQCDHIFCAACIQLSLAATTPERCPVCSEPGSKTQRVPKQIHAALDALRVKCLYAAPDPRGCTFVGPRKEYLAHVRGCGDAATEPAPVAIAPTTPSPPNPAISVRVLSDIPHLVAEQSEPQDLTTMIHLDAPKLESLEDRRQGITLTAVIDVSGSMKGAKLALMKEALLFMVGQLSPKDSFGIITFATEVAEALPMKNMDASYKISAEQVIHSIQATSCTNLSGGLFAGIDQACSRPFRGGKGGPVLAVPFRGGKQAPRPASSASSSIMGSIANLFASPSSSSSGAPPRHADTMNPSTSNCAVPRPAPPPPAVSSSTKAAPTAVLLFTDGQANEGICDRTQLFAALKTRLSDAAHVAVHTFGFGTDHDALLLQGIAEQSQGSYYFIKDQSVLKDSFADCLGGLVSVVSTGLTLRMAVAGGGACEVAQLMTKFPVTVEDDGTHVIAIKDLYSGESRDIPVQLKVRTAGVKSGAVMPLLTWTLSYHSTVDERAHTETAKSTVLTQPTKFCGTIDVTVDEQRNRFLAAVALEEARKAAESRNFTLARQHISACSAAIAKTTSAHTTYSTTLQHEMGEMMDAVQDERHYAAEGSRGINQVMMRHQQQRCNDASESDAVMYQTSWKQEMKRRTK